MNRKVFERKGIQGERDQGVDVQEMGHMCDQGERSTSGHLAKGGRNRDTRSTKRNKGRTGSRSGGKERKGAWRRLIRDEESRFEECLEYLSGKIRTRDLFRRVVLRWGMGLEGRWPIYQQVINEWAVRNPGIHIVLVKETPLEGMAKWEAD